MCCFSVVQDNDHFYFCVVRKSHVLFFNERLCVNKTPNTTLQRALFAAKGQVTVANRRIYQQRRCYVVFCIQALLLAYLSVWYVQCDLNLRILNLNFYSVDFSCPTLYPRVYNCLFIPAYTAVLLSVLGISENRPRVGLWLTFRCKWHFGVALKCLRVQT